LAAVHAERTLRPSPGCRGLMRLVVGISGATGAPLGVALLEALRETAGVETHLIVSKWARATIELECDRSVAEVAALAAVVHQPGDQAATISSGSSRPTAW
jgi:flavin prenyltransferase